MNPLYIMEILQLYPQPGESQIEVKGFSPSPTANEPNYKLVLRLKNLPTLLPALLAKLKSIYSK